MLHFTTSLNETDVRIKQDIGYLALDVSHCGVIVLSSALDKYRILYANAAFLSTTGYSEDELEKRIGWYVGSGCSDDPQRNKLRAALSAAQPISIDMRNYRKDGSLHWCALSITPFRNYEGVVSHYIGMLSDITARKHNEQFLPRQSRRAPLTGLTDQIGLSDYLNQVIAGSAIGPVGLIVVAIDIDQFQYMTSDIDRASYDHLIRSMSEQIGHCLAADEMLSHEGNGSYALMYRTGSRLVAVERCQAIQRALAKSIRCANQNHHITCTFGLAVFQEDSQDAGMLLKHAGLALSRAREIARSSVCFYTDAMSLRMNERHVLESALRTAITNGEMDVYYQPQINLQSGKIICVEALARWVNSTLGAVTPDRFIPLAEEIGLINDIGTWVIERVCRDMAEWSARGFPLVRVAVNVSAVQFRNPLLGDQIMTLLNLSGISPDLLTLEITEAVLMDDTGVALATLRQLSQAGIGLSLDDFGRGYSSLSYLTRFPFKKIVIDRSFIHALVDNPDNAAIVKAIISMAHTLGVKVLAEGVETEAQCLFLSENMCDEVQGFLFSPAVTAPALLELLSVDITLQSHLLTEKKAIRTLLLVDDEANILSALKRLLRSDDFRILTAHSGSEGLAMLAQYPVDVILSDQRMPGMTGVEFLSIAKTRFPDTVRIVLSGYTELQSVTDAVNEGDIYKFLTKPWDDKKLRGHIDEAFQRKDLADENRRLTRAVYATNLELSAANRQLRHQHLLHQQLGTLQP